MLDQLNRSHGAEAGRGNQSPRFQHVAASGPQNPMHKFRLHATCFPTIDFKFHLPSTHGWAHYTSTVDRSARSLRSRDLVPPLSFLIASAGGGHGRLRPGSSPGRSVSRTAGSVDSRPHLLSPYSRSRLPNSAIRFPPSSGHHPEAEHQLLSRRPAVISSKLSPISIVPGTETRRPVRQDFGVSNFSLFFCNIFTASSMFFRFGPFLHRIIFCSETKNLYQTSFLF